MYTNYFDKVFNSVINEINDTYCDDDFLVDNELLDEYYKKLSDILQNYNFNNILDNVVNNIKEENKIDDNKNVFNKLTKVFLKTNILEKLNEEKIKTTVKLLEKILAYRPDIDNVLEKLLEEMKIYELFLNYNKVFETNISKDILKSNIIKRTSDNIKKIQNVYTKEWFLYNKYKKQPKLNILKKFDKIFYKNNDDFNIKYNEYINKTIKSISNILSKVLSIYTILKSSQEKYLKLEEDNKQISYIENIFSKIKKDNTFDSLKEIISRYLPIPTNYNNKIDINLDEDTLIIDYFLPDITNILDIKSINSKGKITKQSNTYMKNLYNNLLINISFIIIDFCFKVKNITKIVFNGYVTTIDKSNGKTIEPCVLSLFVNKEQWDTLNLKAIEPSECFKSLKGVKTPKFEDIIPIMPIISFDKKDKRFIEGYDVLDNVNEGNNLASMDWQDFENLVRDLFELEFGKDGNEVKITQSSRDGGVDAVIFDSDPIKGGKIIVQAKRYTNVVGVSAVRDLYGTVINEGANKGILITTAEYGTDSYNFAKDKPITLLNGGHLLGLLQKHGKKAYINIREAKKILKEQENKK